MVRRLCVCAMAAGLAAVASCRVAETDKREDAPKICSGGAMTRSGSDAEDHPARRFTYEGKQRHQRGLADNYWLLAGRGWPLHPVAPLRSGSYDEEDSVAFQGVDDRLWSLAADPDISWPTGIGLFGLSGVIDTLGIHRGQELEFSYRVLLSLGEFDFIPSAGMRWRSQDIVDYYYGARPGEGRAGRPAYEDEYALDPFVRLAVRHDLTQGWSLLATVQYEWVDDQIRNSSVVDADYDASFMVGMLHAW